MDAYIATLNNFDDYQERDEPLAVAHDFDTVWEYLTYDYDYPEEELEELKEEAKHQLTYLDCIDPDLIPGSLIWKVKLIK